MTTRAAPITSLAARGGQSANSSVPVAVHRTGHVVDRDRRRPREQVGQRAGEGLDALVEVEVGRAVQVVVVELELAGGVGEERA